MLRISVTDSGESTCLALEGSLSGPWVEELRRLSEQLLLQSRSVACDLEKLRYMDSQGAALLRNLAAMRVTHLNCSAFIRQQLGVATDEGGGNE